MTKKQILKNKSSVIVHHSRGLRNAEIAKIVGINPSTVTKYLKEFGVTKNVRSEEERYARKRNSQWKSAARRKNVPYDRTWEDHLIVWKENNWKSDYSDTVMELYGTVGDCRKVISIDQVIPGKGYIKGNVAYCTEEENRWKNDMPIEKIKIERYPLYERIVNNKRIKLND